MFFKILILACVGFFIVSSENSKVDNLNNLMNMIDQQIRGLTSNSAFVLRPLQVSLSYYADQANKAFINNLTVAAQPYWSAVSQAKNKSEEKGQNIDACVETANAQIYATNVTFANKVSDNIQTEVTTGQKLLSDIYDIARNEPNKKLEEMHQRVKNCNEEVCAVELHKQLKKEYSEISTRITTSLDKANDYSNKEFIKKMDQQTSVPQAYHDDVRKTISAFEMCISQK